MACYLAGKGPEKPGGADSDWYPLEQTIGPTPRNRWKCGRRLPARNCLEDRQTPDGTFAGSLVSSITGPFRKAADVGSPARWRTRDLCPCKFASLGRDLPRIGRRRRRGV